MVDFWCRFFTVYAELFTVYKGHKRWKKHLVIDMIFFTVSFSRFAPSRLAATHGRPISHCPLARYLPGPPIVATACLPFTCLQQRRLSGMWSWHWMAALQRSSIPLRRSLAMSSASHATVATSHRWNAFTLPQAVLDGVPPTGLQLLR